jgi:hypothetical protein
MSAGRSWVLALLLFVCIARLWLMPLPSGFWVDEMVTAFVVQHPGDPSLAAAPQVPASVYYWLPAIVQRTLGLSETGYRIPSVLAMLIALAFIARLAARLIHPQAGWFAAFACFAFHGINYEAADARPYALGICCAAAALYFLVRWLDSGRWAFGLMFAACGALVWLVHLIYWPFYLLIGLYALIRLWKGDARPAWLQVCAVFALLGAALIPVAVRAIALVREAGAHVIVPVPSLHTLEHALRWNVPAACGAAAWLLARLLLRRPKPRAMTGASLALIFGWWLVHPMSLFAFSVITKNSVFLSRYLTLALPGAALAATAAASRFLPDDCWKPAAMALGAVVLILMGQWRQRWPSHEISGWREAARLARAEATDARTPIVCPSPFIEAREPAWRPDYPLPGFLYAHLPIYPLRGRPILFPFEISPDAERYAASVAEASLLPAGHFLIYGGAGNVRYWRKWFAARPEFAGWRNRMTPFGDVFLVEFSREIAAAR